MKTRNFAIPVALCLSVAACGEQKKLTEMHDATVNMNKTTEQMNRRTDDLLGTSDRIQSTSQELKATTDELYDALRQGDTLKIRRGAFDALLAAPTMFRKISEAGKYFMSFEFQLWNQVGQDLNPARRDVLAQQATQEFFLEIEELAPRDGSVDPTAQPDPRNIHSKQNRLAAFNAMAVTLHQVNRKQAASLNGTAPVLSMLTLIEESLLSKEKMHSAKGELSTKAPFMREVLAHESKAIQLIQTRYNVFPLVFIDFVTQIGDKSILGKAKMALLGWDLNLDILSPTQLEYLKTEVLIPAVHARDFLRQIGVQPEMNSQVARLLRRMRIQAGGKLSAQTASLQVEVVDLLMNLKKGIEDRPAKYPAL